MKSLISVAIILLVSCTEFVSAVHQSATVCQTDACKTSAEYVLSSIDQTQDPCNDFYQFACGGYIEKHKLPAYATEYGVHDVLTDKALEEIQVILETENPRNTKSIQKAQSLYCNCLNQENDVALLNNEVIHTLGEWPLATGQSNNLSLEVLLANVALAGSDSIFSSNVAVDLINSNQYIIQVDYADLQVAADLGNQANLNAYINGIKATAVALGAPNSQATISQINDLIEFNKKVAEFIPAQEAVTNYTKIYRKSTIGELQQLTDPSGQIFNWSKYLNVLFGLELTSSEPVAINDLEYLIQAIQLINSTARNTVSNYIIGNYVQTYAFHAGGALLQESVTLAEFFNGVTAFEPRNTSCTKLANKVFGYALAKPYVAKTFPASNIPQVKQIAQAMLDAFQVEMSHTNFYDAKTLRLVQEKIAAMQVFVGYPDWINNDTAVDSYYSAFSEMTDSHFTNALNGFTGLVQQNLKLLHTTVDRTDFSILPSDIEIVYESSNNAISLPAGFMHEPYYTAGGLQYLKYGALGSLIGLAISYGIDETGAQFDKNGNLKDIWDESARHRIKGVEHCISNQFETNCSSTDPTKCAFAKAESLSGNSGELDYIFGILGAYDAYQTLASKNLQEPRLPGLEKYTPNQMLFMSFALRSCSATIPANITAKIGYDPQQENKYVIIGALANLKVFAEAFQCKVGLMNRGNETCIPV